jgi:hypothetical protein
MKCQNQFHIRDSELSIPPYESSPEERSNTNTIRNEDREIEYIYEEDKPTINFPLWMSHDSASFESKEKGMQGKE